MKNLKVALFFVLVLLIGLSCEKIPFDFRNKYLGNWKFDISEGHEVFNVTQLFHDTIILRTYHGEIKYGSKHSKIKFQSISYSIEFSIDKDGKIIPVNDHGGGYDESGGFDGEIIFKYHYYHHWGGDPHKFVSTDIDGVKE